MRARDGEDRWLLHNSNRRDGKLRGNRSRREREQSTNYPSSDTLEEREARAFARRCRKAGVSIRDIKTCDNAIRRKNAGIIEELAELRAKLLRCRCERSREKVQGEIIRKETTIEYWIDFFSDIYFRKYRRRPSTKE